ncbi:MAG: class F sortase [Patescibacteria group bacterium]|jgi:LPXTG-site transpeptidase (sortase) family protein
MKNRKSRAKVRPALWRRDFFSPKHIGTFFGAVVYVIAVLVLIQFVSLQLILGFYENSVPTAEAATNGKSFQLKTAATGLPVRILIPKIRVNALINQVGLVADGSMGVPKLPRDTAWYKLGPKPGEAGSAVISGHVNWLYGAKGSFEYLKVLKPGDKIVVQNDKGESISFVVRTSRTLDREANATDVFYSYDGKAHLNLVTCAGAWDKTAKAYSKRLVVFADKVTK